MSKRYFVTIWSTDEGNLVDLFSTPEEAEKQRQEIAEYWWDHEFGRQDIEKLKDPQKLADRYFVLMSERDGEKSFEVHPITLV